LWLGVAIIIGGVLGFVGGGWLGDKFSQSDGIRGRLRVGVLVALTGVPAALIFSWQPNPYVTVALVGVIYMCAAGALPAAVAVLNELAPNQMRGQLAALFIFSVNIVGLGFGATLVALASDYIFTGDTGLRYALLFTTPIGYVLSAICFRLSYGAFERSFKSV
jgi:MFS family permease